MSNSFVLLDDRDATSSNPASRLYTSLVHSLQCRSPDQFDALLEDMQQALRDGLHAVGLFSYEQGAQFHGMTAPPSAQPLSQVLLFEQCQRLSSDDVSVWLAGQERQRESPSRSQTNQPILSEAERPPHPLSDHIHQHASDRWRLSGEDVTSPQEQALAGVANITADIDKHDFCNSIARIDAYLNAGDTYQVNYTYRLRFVSYGSLAALYRKLRARQAVPYGAVIALPDGSAVLSLSPELFLRNDGGVLTARPMKGTAPASGYAAVDAENASVLARDPKNRAENLMIVDMLRNDLGRIAQVGSVSVPTLFDVATYGSVLQMTSTVQARLRPDVGLAELFPALYPCGSITGAPKRRTMQIIEELESAPRGLYTGAIGWFDKPGDGHLIGNFCLSVPIRTLVLGPECNDGTRSGEMGVGAGIVYDSAAAAEYEECRVKAGFLTGAPADFDLFETMHATREAGYRHLELHLQRLRASAAWFGFGFNDAGIRHALDAAQRGLAAAMPYRARLTLNHSGRCSVETALISPLPAIVRVLMAPNPVKIDRMLLRHKITARTQYDNAWRSAEAQGAFDMLFQNEEGELTEGARSNVFLLRDGEWCTPPLAAGVLPGIMRCVVLADPQWRAKERRLTLDDLHHAEKIVVCNALRGVMPARLG